MRTTCELLLGSALLCTLLTACGDQSDCVGSYCDEFDIAYSSPDPAPCESLDESACQRSDRCILDSVCVSSRSCSGSGCSDLCELQRVCLPYD